MKGKNDLAPYDLRRPLCNVHSTQRSPNKAIPGPSIWQKCGGSELRFWSATFSSMARARSQKVYNILMAGAIKYTQINSMHTVNTLLHSVALKKNYQCNTTLINNNN